MKKIFALILFACGIVTAQAQVTGLELPYGIKVLDSLATDAWYGPYPNIDSALSHVPSAVRKNRTVKIDTLEYWWRDGVEDEDLVVKTSPGGVDLKAGNGIEIIDGDSLVFVGKNVTVDSIDIMAGKRFSIGFMEGEFAPKAFYADSTFVGTDLSQNLFGQMRYTGSGISHDGYRSTYSSDDNYNFEEYAGIGLPGGGQGSRLEVSNLTSEVILTREISPNSWITTIGSNFSSYTLGQHTFSLTNGVLPSKQTTIFTNRDGLTASRNINATFTKQLGESTYRHFSFSMGDRQSDDDSPAFRIHGWESSSTQPSMWISSDGPSIFANFEVDGSGRIRSNSYLELTPLTNQIYLGDTRRVIINAVQPATTSRTWTIADEGGDRTFASREYVTTQLMDSINNAIDTLSAGGSTNATAIRGVTVDPSASSPSDGDILVYRNDDSAWVLEAKPTGGGGGGVEIAEVMDSIANAIDSLVSITQIEAMLDTLDTGGGGGSGTVESVDVSAPTGMTSTGGPVTTTGTIALDWDDGYGPYSDSEASKLSGIEAGADVTDATNVAAAGALMKAGDTATGKINFTKGATDAPLNIDPSAGDPSSLVRGDFWHNTTNNRLYYRSGASETVAIMRASIDGLSGGGRIPYTVSNNGQHTTDANFTFESSTSTLSTPSISVSTGATLPAATSIGNVSSTEIGYLDNVTSSIQTQLNSKQTITPTSSTGTAVAFDTNRSYCTSASPCTGNITFTSSGAIVGQMATMIHNDSSEPTFGSEFIILSGEYATNEDNYIMFFLRESGKVWVTISQEQ